MSDNSLLHSVFSDSMRNFRGSWKSLVITNLVFKAIAFIILTPLVAILFRAMLSLSGSEVLADQDILFFLLGPLGWLCLVTVGAISLGVIGLEQAALLGIIGAHSLKKRIGTVGALRFAASQAWPVLQVTVRIVAFSLVAVAPFLAIAAAVFFSLLTEFDINYYMKEQPPAFKLAVGIGAILVVSMAAVLLRLGTGWFFALPLVIFENTPPSQSLKASRERADGHRRTISLWILGWALGSLALSSLTTALVGALGHWIVPQATSSLQWLAAAIGITLLVWAVVGLAVNLVTTLSFSVILFSLFRKIGRLENSANQNDPWLENSPEFDPHDTRFQFTRKRILAGGIVGIVAAIAIGGAAIYSVPLQENPVLVMAHRGASSAAPENTMAAMRKAIEEGADWVEIDVQEIADGTVVVFHDSDFMKLSGVDLKIWNATLDDLKNLDIGSWFAPEFKEERVPTLKLLLDECHGKVNVNIELKYYGHDQQLEQRVAQIVKSCDMAGQVMLMSLKIDGVKKMKSLQPEWKVGLLMSIAKGNLKKIEADFLAVNASFANRRLIRDAHDCGKQVFVWTVNDAPTMSSMIGRGVDGLLTDKPGLARRVIEQRSQMSVTERMLLELAGLLGVPPEISDQ